MIISVLKLNYNKPMKNESICEIKYLIILSWRCPVESQGHHSMECGIIGAPSQQKTLQLNIILLNLKYIS